MTESVLILGATSAIGRALAHEYAAAGASLALAARDESRLELERDDILARHSITVTIHRIDILDECDHHRFIAELTPLPTITICLIGLLDSQPDMEVDPERAQRVLQTNFNAPVQLLGRIANAFELRGSGTIIGVSSVAGERGRATNYIYGSAKAGFTAWLSGLRNRLHSSGVHVMTVKPGFVHTRMTDGMDLPRTLTATPIELARNIRRAQIARRDVIYRRRIWCPIMVLIRLIPEVIFKRLRL